VAFGLVAFFAPAAAGTIPDIVFTLQARNDGGNGSFSVTSDKGNWDPNSETFTWSLPGPIEIRNDATGARIATLLDAYVMFCTQQLYEIDVNIGVISGRSETIFAIDSALISFPTIPVDSAEARATACFAITDLEGDDACLTGLGPPGTGAFRSYYNGYLADGTRFTHLIGRIFVSGGGERNRLSE